MHDLQGDGKHFTILNAVAILLQGISDHSSEAWKALIYNFDVWPISQC